MSRYKVAYFDVDGVFRDIYYKLRNIPNTYYHKDSTKFFKDVFSRKDHEVFNFFINMPIYAGSIEFLKVIHKLKLFEEIYIISAQNHSMGVKATNNFISKYGFDKIIDNVIYTKSGSEKVEIISKNPGLVFEDRAQTLAELPNTCGLVWLSHNKDDYKLLSHKKNLLIIRDFLSCIGVTDLINIL